MAPVLNLIKIAADECVRKNFKKAAVLGIKATMQNGLYHNEFRLRDIESIIPEKSVSILIDNLIMNEIIPSNINIFAVEKVAEEIKKLKCDGVILGCTELPEVYNQENLGMPVVDTTRLLAQKAYDMAANTVG